MFCHLAGHLVHQLHVGDRDQGVAADTFEVQGIRPAVLSGQPVQVSLAAGAAQVWLQAEGRAVLGRCVASRFLLDHSLDSLECLRVNDSGISLLAGVAGILQQALHLVLVPERRFHAERYTVTVERFRNALIGTSSDILRCDSLNRFHFLGDDGQLTVFDVVAIQILSVGHLPTSRSCSASSMPP